MNLVGCKHNLERRFEYPKQKEWKKWTRPTFEPGQLLTLVCPKGCQTIYIMLTTQGDK